MAEADSQGKLEKAYGFNPIAAQQGLWSTDPVWQANVQNGSLTAQDTSFHYLHTDHLGTPQLATTKDGQTSWKAQSEAFGAAGILQNQSAITMNLRFPGQYFDQETGTHYNFNRDYKPITGRYLESDPLKVAAGVNFFLYAAAEPVFGSDPLGLICYTHRYPIGFETVTDIKKIGEWGKWKYENMDSQGNEQPAAFWIAYNCMCSRERPVQINRKLVLKIFKEEICIGSCFTTRNTSTEYITLWRFTPQDKEKELKLISGSLAMNEAAAKLDCDKRCENLNK